jgi:hypothetical protein
MKQKIIGSSAKYKCNQYNNELTQETRSENVDSKSKSVESKKYSNYMQFPTCHAQVQSYILSFTRIHEK